MSSKVADILISPILDALEAGTVPWKRQWAHAPGFRPMNATTQRPYNGLNHLILGMKTYELPYYLTFNQAVAAGGCVKEGESGTAVVFWKYFDEERAKPGTNEVKRETASTLSKGRPPMMRYYNVFNVAQCVGLEKLMSKLPPAPPPPAPEDKFKAAEAIVGAVDWVRLKHSVNKIPQYRPMEDEVIMPFATQYADQGEYYSSLFHEFSHATGHPERLARRDHSKMPAYGDRDYAREELVAELGANFLMIEAGLANPLHTQNSTAYIKYWLEVLRENPTLLTTAAQQAEKAANWVLGIRPEIEHWNQPKTREENILIADSAVSAAMDRTLDTPAMA